jgi:hypothetical protein
MQEAMMQVSVWLVSWFLLAATVGASAFGSANDAVLTGGMGGDAAGSQRPVRLAGANGHDSVGPAAVASGRRSRAGSDAGAVMEARTAALLRRDAPFQQGQAMNPRRFSRPRSPLRQKML